MCVCVCVCMCVCVLCVCACVSLYACVCLCITSCVFWGMRCWKSTCLPCKCVFLSFSVTLFHHMNELHSEGTVEPATETEKGWFCFKMVALSFILVRERLSNTC